MFEELTMPLTEPTLSQTVECARNDLPADLVWHSPSTTGRVRGVENRSRLVRRHVSFSQIAFWM